MEWPALAPTYLAATMHGLSECNDIARVQGFRGRDAEGNRTPANKRPMVREAFGVAYRHLKREVSQYWKPTLYKRPLTHSCSGKDDLGMLAGHDG